MAHSGIVKGLHIAALAGLRPAPRCLACLAKSEVRVSDEVPPRWAKLFVDGALRPDAFPFGVEPLVGLTFHEVATAHVLRIETVEADPDILDRFIVHAKRIG
jgi:hypothetical protein